MDEPATLPDHPADLMDNSDIHESAALDIIENIIRACDGLTITPDQLRDELIAGGDMESIETGELSARGLRFVARTLDLMRYGK